MHVKLQGWLVIALLLGTLTYALAEEITLTTYYPSPRGVYDELRTAGNVQIGRIDPPGLADTAPRLHVVRRNADTDPADTGRPALLVEDEIPNATTPDPTPFVIDQDGNVGIGTASPALGMAGPGPGTTITGTKLDISGASGDTGLVVKSGSGGGAWLGACNNGTEACFHQWPSTTARTTFRRHDGMVQMTLDNDGNVGIGTVTSPTSKKLEVAGDIRVSGNVDMGYQRVASNCGITTDCWATCPGGKYLLGGGCHLEVAWVEHYGHPWSDTTFFCVQPPPAKAALSTHAICANIRP